MIGFLVFVLPNLIVLAALVGATCWAFLYKRSTVAIKVGAVFAWAGGIAAFLWWDHFLRTDPSSTAAIAYIWVPVVVVVGCIAGFAPCWSVLTLKRQRGILEKAQSWPFIA